MSANSPTIPNENLADYLLLQQLSVEEMYEYKYAADDSGDAVKRPQYHCKQRLIQFD